MYCREQVVLFDAHKNKSQSRGVRPRTPITFFMRLKKVIQETTTGGVDFVFA